MGWELYPDGPHAFLRRFAATAPRQPIFVTENGVATDVSPEGGARVDFL